MTVGFGPLDRCFDLVPLGSVALAIKDGTHGTHTRVREGVPFLSAKNISAAGAICWGEDDDRITESEYAFIHQTFRLEDCDLLLTIVGSLGRRAIYRGERVTFQRSVAYIRPDAKKCSERFLFHWFGHPCFQQELVRRSNATAQAGLYLGELAKVSVPKCPNKEQSQIARVLDTLDTTIRQTEAIIAKLKQVKQGLLHDLLNRGIDANGELRPLQCQASHLYKQSPLGWIPLEWEVRPLTSYTSADITYGIVQAGPDIAGGVPYIRTGDMSGDCLVRESLLCTSRRIADSYKRSEVRTGDLVMAIRATVGKVLSVPRDLDGANLTQGTARIAPGARTNPSFLLWAIRHDRAQKSILAEIKGTTFAEITLADLRQVPLAAPIQLEEQRLISQRVQACDDAIKREQRHLVKLRAQKSGLMDDLLIGRVRVTALLAAAASR
jgi:type I restriction enzyme S subunit